MGGGWLISRLQHKAYRYAMISHNPHHAKFKKPYGEKTLRE